MGDKGATLALLLILCSLFVTLPSIGAVEATGTVYIREDGSVEGTEKIQRDGTVYTFTDDIYGSLVVERDHVVVDGAGYSIEGQHTNQAESPEGIGIQVENRNTVTIRNVTVRHFMYGICINRSSNIHIRNSIIENNINDGICLFFSSCDNIDLVDYCAIRDNGVGIWIVDSSFWYLLTQNNITNNSVGICLETSCTFIEFNNIANNGVGVQIAGSDNKITHNNFVNNTQQVYDVVWDNPELSPSVNRWDSGEDGGDTGNYWSDYNGNGETPYIIYENNQDNFPAIKPFTIPNEPRLPDTVIYTASDVILFIIIVVAAGLVGYFVKVRPLRKTKK